MASGADRISDLPEGVLHDILSLLPARDAARTCALARSWRARWRSVPAVRFACSAGLAGDVNAFVHFVNGLLRVRTGAPPLDSCDFDLDVAGLDPAYYSARDLDLHSSWWIRRVLQLKVRQLRFRFRFCSYPFGRPLELDDVPLSSQHLTSLELTGVDGAGHDFSGCSALESLKMEGCHVWSSEMQSPYLKHLSIRCCRFFPDYRTRMSFPSLVSFEFINNYGRAPVLGRMQCLETAKVRFDHVFNEEDRCINGRLYDCGDEDCWCCF